MENNVLDGNGHKPLILLKPIPVHGHCTADNIAEYIEIVGLLQSSIFYCNPTIYNNQITHIIAVFSVFSYFVFSFFETFIQCR